MLVTRYETLRRVALGRSGPEEGPSLGFTVLLRHGMPAWLRAWATVAHPAGPGPSTGPRSASPPLVHREIVQVWAQMVLAHWEATWISPASDRPR